MHCLEDLPIELGSPVYVRPVAVIVERISEVLLTYAMHHIPVGTLVNNNKVDICRRLCRHLSKRKAAGIKDIMRI